MFNIYRYARFERIKQLAQKNQKWYLIPLLNTNTTRSHVIKSESIESRLSPDSLDSVWTQWTQLLLELYNTLAVPAVALSKNQ